MKMGTIVSQSHYDAAARHALQCVNVRRPAILRYASWGLSFGHRKVVRLPFDSSPLDQSWIDVMCHKRISVRHLALACADGDSLHQSGPTFLEIFGRVVQH